MMHRLDQRRSAHSLGGERSSEAASDGARVRTRDFETWLNSAPKSPAEMVLKNRLRELLDRRA